MRSRDKDSRPGRRREAPMPHEPDEDGGLAVIVIAKPKRPKRRRGKVDGKQPEHRNGRRARGGAAKREDGENETSQSTRRYGGSVVSSGTSHPAHSDPRRHARVGHEARRQIGGGVPTLTGPLDNLQAPTVTRNTLPPAPEPTPQDNPTAEGLDALLVAKALRGKNPPIGGFLGSGLSPAQQAATTAAAEDAIAGGVGAGGGAGSVYKRGGRMASKLW